MDILQQVQNQKSANEQNVETNWYNCFTKNWANLCPVLFCGYIF